MFNEKNYCELYHSHGENLEDKAMAQLNEWLSKNNIYIRVEVELDPDGEYIRFFTKE